MVERGNAAEEVLRSEAFQMAANALMDIYIQGIIQSSPEEKEKRELGYAQARAVQDIVGILNQWVAIRDQIIANNDSDNEDTI